MIKPRDYDTAQAKTNGTDTVAPYVEAGGHGCKIYKAEIQKDSYGEKLILYYDIEEGGEFDNFYKRKHDRQKQYNSNAAWPGIFRQPVYTKDGSTSPFFKGLITCIENSNDGYKFDFDEKTLIGKKIGLVFREEEYIGQFDTNVHTTSRPAWACDYQNADMMPAPKKKLLNPNSATPPTDNSSLTLDNSQKLPWD